MVKVHCTYTLLILQTTNAEGEEASFGVQCFSWKMCFHYNHTQSGRNCVLTFFMNLLCNQDNFYSTLTSEVSAHYNIPSGSSLVAFSFLCVVGLPPELSSKPFPLMLCAGSEKKRTALYTIQHSQKWHEFIAQYRLI